MQRGRQSAVDAVAGMNAAVLLKIEKRPFDNRRFQCRIRKVHDRQEFWRLLN